MTHKQIYVGQQLQKINNVEVGGKYVDIEGETFYQIENYDRWRISLSV